MSAPPRDFNHPYKPYYIQEEFMNAVYDCIDQGKVGIFESPTGTGKSLSLICGSLTWLREFKRREFGQASVAGEIDQDEPDWVLQHAREQKRRAVVGRRAELEARLARVRMKEERARQRYETGEPHAKRLKTEAIGGMRASAEDAFMLDDYQSEDNDDSHSTHAHSSKGTAFSAETQALMNKIGLLLPAKKEDDAAMDDELKIFFCSRTHSQLSQFVTELRKVHFPPAIPPDPAGVEEGLVSREEEQNEGLRHISLGSRKNLCINPNVTKLGSLSAINERCLDIQKSSKSADQKCRFIPKKDNEALVNDFRDHTLAKIRDIEDMGAVGKKLGICPYYASRASIAPAEIVTLPYPLLLQRAARESLNLSLKNHIVIIDEAHNLINAITDIHAASLTLQQLDLARSQLGDYLQKFRNRLKGKNRIYVAQLVRVIDSLAGYLRRLTAVKEPEGIAAVSDLLSGKGCDQVNLFKLMQYLQESKLARKVEGYLSLVESESHQVHEASRPPRAGNTPVLMQVQSFLLALTNPAAEGQFFYRNVSDLQQLQYTLLDPTHHFKDIVEEARAVILAGGTMAPMSDFTEHLFNYVPKERIITLSCGHVIPKTNLLAIPVPKGVHGTEFDFTFEKRKSITMIQQLGQSILDFSKIVPDGLVVFFPSYAYLSSAVQAWQSSHASQPESLWEDLSRQKRIFIEPKAAQHTSPSSGASIPTSKAPASIDALLTAYSAHIHSPASNPRGALLLAVIGGSLSEGINFSDRLGRGVIVVGLPFPNPYSSEWKAKLDYISRRVGREGSVGTANQEAVRDYTLNATMRAVNQSIGRAIRHKDDYAAILLLDRRYDSTRVRERLPGWIKECVTPGREYGDVMASVTAFFEEKSRVR